jgi:hypothetical protein
MTKLTLSRTIQAPADRVWNILADFGGVHLFHPMVESSPVTNGQDTGLGARRRCELSNGTEVNEEITSFNPERRNLGITVLEPAPPMEAMTGEFTVTPRDDSSCEVLAIMEYSLIGGALGKEEIDGLQAMMEDVVESVLNGLDNHAIIGNMGKHLSTPAGATA